MKLSEIGTKGVTRGKTTVISLCCFRSSHGILTDERSVNNWINIHIVNKLGSKGSPFILTSRAYLRLRCGYGSDLLDI